MPKTSPLPDLTGGDAYLIGGGRSLRGFAFEQLLDKNTIGCNQAFMLGAEICKILFFGDNRFWIAFHRPLQETYEGWVVTNCKLGECPPWVQYFERQDEGLASNTIAWNGNSGAAAINLALLLGARRVFLLGYDLGMDVTRSKDHDSSHWHDKRIEVPTPDHYARFALGFFALASGVPDVFPGRQIINVHNGTSQLKCFPSITFKEAGLLAP